MLNGRALDNRAISSSYSMPAGSIVDYAIASPAIFDLLPSLQLLPLIPELDHVPLRFLLLLPAALPTSLPLSVPLRFSRFLYRTVFFGRAFSLTYSTALLTSRHFLLCSLLCFPRSFHPPLLSPFFIALFSPL